MSVEFRTGSPVPALAGTVVRYTGYAERAAGPVTFRELPSTVVPVILDLDAGWTVAHHQSPDEPLYLDSFVAGLTDKPVLVGHGGSARCLQVDLTPLGARRLFGVPMSELANRSIPIDDVLGWGRGLVQRIGEAPDWAARFALLDQALHARLTEAAPVDTELAWALRRVVKSGGAAAIGELAGELGWSHRRLIARFRDAVGLPPKRLARIVRFERLTTMLDAPTLDWAVAAITCGYYDQAHLVREVRDLGGVTPTELRAAVVNFVQDDVVLSA